MPLKGPCPEDLRKIHAEVTQIANQRFLITTFAITVFGVFAALLIPKNDINAGDNISLFTIAGSILLTLLLGALYIFSHFFLRGMLRIYTTYLIITDTSGWECDWQAYRDKFKWYLGSTKAQAGIFLLLGAISASFPFAIILAYSLNLYPWSWLYADIAVGVAYLIFVLLIGVFGLCDPEHKAMERWQELKRKPESSLDAKKES